MSIYKVNGSKGLDQLFDRWDETLVWSCLQGCMGTAWADSEENIKSAQLVIADFCFFAGVPNVELVKNKPDSHQSDFIIMVPRTKEWGDLIQQTYREKATKITRYAIKKEADVFDLNKLKQFVSNIKEPFQVCRIDKQIYEQAMSNNWSRDLCSNFKDYEDYKERGIGVAVTDHGVLVSGASSYTIYKEGIEIEIDTREDYRRRGLALACGAVLIIECLERGLYPSWDAQNKGSVALAEKLGYHFDKEYEAYEIIGY